MASPIVGLELLQILVSAQSETDSNTRCRPFPYTSHAQLVVPIDRYRYEVDWWDPGLGLMLVRLIETQSVFGRWRAITMTRIKPDLETWRRDVMKHFKLLIESASWDAP